MLSPNPQTKSTFTGAFCVKGEKLAKALTNRKYSDIIDNGL